VVVVAGVVIDGDGQFRMLVNYLGDLVEKYVPEEKRENFAFHAKELVNGGKTFVRGIDDDKRIEVLHRMAEIPAKFLLPIIFGWHRRGVVPGEKDQGPRREAIMAQAMAFSQCAVVAERYMREFARQDEVAMCIAEDNPTVRLAIKALHGLLSNPRPTFEFPGEMAAFLPIARIIDTVHFAAKTEAALLQIADICAYTIKRYLAGAAHADALLDLMTRGQLPKDDLDAGAGYRAVILSDVTKLTSGRSWMVSPAAPSRTGTWMISTRLRSSD
jgi:hypothetical protein